MCEPQVRSCHLKRGGGKECLSRSQDVYDTLAFLPTFVSLQRSFDRCDVTLYGHVLLLLQLAVWTIGSKVAKSVPIS